MGVDAPSSADGLATRLRSATRTLHTEVERGPFMHALLRGQLGQAAYCALLRNLHSIYAALESALVLHAADVLVSPVYFPALFRRDALARDLEVLHGKAWAQEIDLQPVCRAYVAQLQQVQASNPALLVAHSYVRYLGDLSGGQMLKRIVAKSFQLEAGAGTAFYDFGDVGQTARLTQAFRAGLDSLAPGETQTGRIVSEAVLAFELHRSLFQQLDAAQPPSLQPVLRTCS